MSEESTQNYVQFIHVGKQQKHSCDSDTLTVCNEAISANEWNISFAEIRFIFSFR